MADDFATRAAALVQRAGGDHPQSWMPRNPEKRHPQMIVGELVRVETGHTRNWRPKRIVVLRTPEGREWGIWLMWTTLLQEFEEQAPKIGELVCVRYEGHVDGGAGASGYEKYRVLVERDVDWDSTPATF